MTPANPDECPQGVENRERITALEDRIDKVEEAVIEIRDKLLGRLPVWATFALSALASLAVGLVVALLKN